MEKTKHSVLINCGPRELEIFGKIREDLRGLTNMPDNKNEIARRALHSFRYLIEVNESLLLSVLSTNLKLLYNEFNDERFEFSKNLTLTIYAAMICKRGTSESELFEPVVLNMNAIDEFKKHQAIDADAREKIRTIIDHVSKSIDIIFLKKADLSSKFQELESYYEKKDFDIRMEHPSDILLVGTVNIFNPDSMEFEYVQFPNLVMRGASGQESHGETIEAASSSKRTSEQMVLVKGGKSGRSS